MTSIEIKINIACQQSPAVQVHRDDNTIALDSAHTQRTPSGIRIANMTNGALYVTKDNGHWVRRVGPYVTFCDGADDNTRYKLEHSQFKGKYTIGERDCDRGVCELQYDGVLKNSPVGNRHKHFKNTACQPHNINDKEALKAFRAHKSGREFRSKHDAIIRNRHSDEMRKHFRLSKNTGTWTMR